MESRAVRGVVIAILVLLGGCQSPPSDPIRNLELYSQPFQVKGLITSMAGPGEDRHLMLSEETPELLWILGYEAQLVQGDDNQPVPERFMCHASLDQYDQVYQARMAPRIKSSHRLFTVSQGVTKVEFPEGFGLPIPSDQLLWSRTQILNLDSEVLPEKVRFRVRITYIKDSDLKEPLKPLFMVRVPGLKATNPDAIHFGGVVSDSGCSVGINANPENYLEYDSKGEAFISHWKVLPGREVTKTLVNEYLSLPDDLRIHTLVTHLHPTAESLTLVNLTNMDPVYRAEVKKLPGDKLGIEAIDVYSSSEGLPLKKADDYGLVSVYDNHTERELDSMAVMYLYVHDPLYVPPTALEMATPTPPRTRVVQRGASEVELTSELPLEFVSKFYEDSLGSEWTLGDRGKDWVEWSHAKGSLRVEKGRRTRIQLRM